MAPKRITKARRKNIQIARQCTQRNIRKIELRFAVAALVSGLTFTQVQYFMTIMGHKTPFSRPARFYQIQKIVSQIIIGFARKNVEKYRNLMSHPTVISLDGSWDHRHNGKFCIVDAFDTVQGKIIDYEIIKRKASENSDESFSGPSNQMEIEGVKKNCRKIEYQSKNHWFCPRSRCEDQ